MDAAPARSRSTRLAGYLFALGAGALWGSTGPLSTALYAEGGQITSIGFWRVLLATLGLAAYGLTRPGLFRIDRKGLLVTVGIGGAQVAVFEVAFQYAIAGVGVAPAVALLYTAPVLVAFLARPILGEALTPLRVGLAVVVMLGVALTVTGGPEAGYAGRVGPSARALGIAGGLMAAASYATQTLMARWAVPRYGAVKVLFLQLLGGTLLLAVLLPLFGKPVAAPATPEGWGYVVALGIGTVVLANFLFYAAVRRIDAAPTAVAASVEPVVGALLALVLFQQGLTVLGWLGLALVVGGVTGGYREEEESPDAGRLAEAQLTR